MCRDQDVGGIETETPEVSRDEMPKASNKLGVYGRGSGAVPPHQKISYFFQLKWHAVVHPEKNFCYDI